MTWLAFFIGAWAGATLYALPLTYLMLRKLFEYEDTEEMVVRVQRRLEAHRELKRDAESVESAAGGEGGKP